MYISASSLQLQCYTHILHGLELQLHTVLHAVMSYSHSLPTSPKSMYSLSISSSLFPLFYLNTLTHTHTPCAHNIYTQNRIIQDHLTICANETHSGFMQTHQACSHTVCARPTHSSVNNTFFKYYMIQLPHTLQCMPDTYHKHTRLVHTHTHTHPASCTDSAHHIPSLLSLASK